MGLAWGDGSGTRRRVSDESSACSNSATVLSWPGRMQSGAISPSGCRTKRRRWARGWGRTKFGRGQDLPAKSDQIQVNHAGFIEDFFGRASDFFFQGLQAGHQGARGFGGARHQAGHGVDEAGRAGRAVHRGGFPQGGAEQRPVGEGLQQEEGAEDVLAPVAQIGAQGHEGH